MRFQCNVMRFKFYDMRNWNEELDDMVCYAMHWCAMILEQKQLHIQKSSKHFGVKW